MPQVRRFADFLLELQQLDRASIGSQAPRILEAFTRHTSFDIGALYLREGRDTPLRLCAKGQQFVAPEILDRSGDLQLDGPVHLLLPLRSQREDLGVLALVRRGSDEPSDDDVAVVRAAADYLSVLISNQRLLQEAREGEFQLKYRLWELDSLYDIGLSIASTLNIDELADEILFRMISLINARRAALFLREGDGYVLYRSFGGVNGQFLDRDIAAELMREGEPISFNEKLDCIFPECSAFVAVPIRGNNAMIGVLAAADRESRDGSTGSFEANEIRLLGLFASQAAIALENARLHKEALEKQAMQRDLELAATIQRDILPKAIPKLSGIELAALSRPARQVGGDYHAFVERDGVLTIVVADVAGKSMPAALLVSALHAAIQLLFAEGRDIGDITTELNKHIHRWSAENKFVTMIMASIDTEADTIEFVNAGHNPGYIVVDGKLETLKSQGLPIGILGQSRYKSQTRSFPPGSLALLYSDGITEAENVAGEEFENERLEPLIPLDGSATAEMLRDRVAESVDAFVAGAPQKDDQTLVIARRV
ncbi:MAG TPA: SpoIIE family protein phosphatase [Thermoanaerobaculia bacterium]|nr:SpoIIE family protein phosphatase [Thermoanaerobaculia bacterium]